MKTCRICETSKPATEFYKPGAVCKSCRRAESRARMAEFRQTEAYRAWLVDSRERRNALKAKYRIQAGCKTREQLAEERAQRMRDADKKRAEREYFNRSFIGPPTPASAMNVAEYHRWRYRNEPAYREYHIKKRKKVVETVTPAYAKCRLGMKSAPPDLIEAQRLFMLIKRQLREAAK